MTPYLVFTLSANLGAMGEFAGHERRGSLDWPGRSAIIGLLGAALGLRRTDDFSELEQLRMAVAIFGDTTPLRDFHTVQTVPTAKARRPQSRPQALRDARGDLNTIITLRDYRCTPLYGVALWGAGVDTLLARVQQALLRPAYVLYLGRKSCPLSAPLAPRQVQADTPQQALAHIALPPWRRGETAHRMAADDALAAEHHQQRQDQALDRVRWHFASRRVAMLNVSIAPEAAA
ncbi:MAG: type I-E CRISPR-associated protein Cas5/CasD [Burkholderiales bacterium]|nr:type I-E CRISPR-associated protein Cas5/CasD [Burkholderiales bacterium]